jgi:hypothetical protein
MAVSQYGADAEHMASQLIDGVASDASPDPASRPLSPPEPLLVVASPPPLDPGPSPVPESAPPLDPRPPPLEALPLLPPEPLPASSLAPELLELEDPEDPDALPPLEPLPLPAPEQTPEMQVSPALHAVPLQQASPEAPQDAVPS